MNDHERAVNEFFEKAEMKANKKVSKLTAAFETRDGRGGGTYRHCFWTEFFHKEMNRLTKKAGLRV